MRSYLPEGTNERVTVIHDEGAPTKLRLVERRSWEGVTLLGVRLGGLAIEMNGSVEGLSESEEQRLCDLLREREAIRRGWA